MKQTEKDLLLKDLCMRLPYNVKVEAKGLLKTIENNYNDRNIINAHVLNGLNLGNHFKTYSINSIANIPLFNRNGVCNIKPYLFPLDSMTEEQDKEFALLQTSAGQEGFLYACNCANMINWFIKNHFDYNGLIPMDLANDATNLNIY